LTAYAKQFKGLCRNCGKYRHKAAHCKDNHKGTFSFCNEPGHEIFHCDKFVQVKKVFNGDKDPKTKASKAIKSKDEDDSGDESYTELGY
jgi:hypothetical protein